MSKLSLLLITDGYDEHTRGRVERAGALLGGLPVAVQLRWKAATSERLYVAATELVAVLDGALPLVVNDRLDVAQAAGAAGVHLPSGGLTTQEARTLWPGALLGRSCHTVAEVERAEGADYVLLSPIRPTASKPGATPLGVDVLVTARTAPTQVLGLGGLTADDLARCRELGAGVACIQGGLGAASEAEVEHNLASWRRALTNV